jgi:hypothetical protein
VTLNHVTYHAWTANWTINWQVTGHDRSQCHWTAKCPWCHCKGEPTSFGMGQAMGPGHGLPNLDPVKTHTRGPG